MPHINSNSTRKPVPGYLTSKRGALHAFVCPPAVSSMSGSPSNFKPDHVPRQKNTSTPCPAGKFANEAGSRVCQKCIPTYSPRLQQLHVNFVLMAISTQDGASTVYGPQGTIAVGGTSFVPISEGGKAQMYEKEFASRRCLSGRDTGLER